MSSRYKRKRYTEGVPLGYSPAGRLRSGPRYHPMVKRRRSFAVGRDRVGGYYGRFSGPAGELKFHDLTVDDAIVATAGEITPSLNLIGQGITESLRVGRKCTIKSIWWRVQFDLPKFDAIAAPNAGDTVRAIIYLDKQCNGATATVTDILNTADWRSFRNLSNQGRFTILMDKLHTVNYMQMASDGAGLVSGGATVRDYTYYKKCNTPIEFDDTTGAITEIRSNNYGLLVIGSTNTMGMGSFFRLRFSDF